MKKVKIISDGSSSGTRVLDLETGKEIPGIAAVNIKISAQSRRATAFITLVRQAEIDMDVEMEGESDV